MKKRKNSILIAFAVMGALLMGACGYSTESDMVAVRVGAGPWESKKVKGCVDASSRKWFWQTNDSYVKFPTNERYWEASTAKDADQGRYTSVTKDSVVMKIPVTVRFTLRTDCETLTDFYNNFAKRNDAYFENSKEYSDGWVQLLRQLIAQPTDTSLDRIIQGYTWRQVWQDPAVKTEIEAKLLASISAENSLLVKVANGKSYFTDFSVIVGSSDPANSALKNAVAEEQTRVSQAQSEEAQARADAAKAEAQLAVSRAEAAKKRAEINGYPSVEAYLKALCIQQGCNPYQPQYYGGPNVK